MLFWRQVILYMEEGANSCKNEKQAAKCHNPGIYLNCQVEPQTCKKQYLPETHLPVRSPSLFLQLFWLLTFLYFIFISLV